MCPISQPRVSGREVGELSLPYYFCFVVSFCTGFIDKCRIALTPTLSVCHSTQWPSFMHPVTSTGLLQPKMKKPPDPFKEHSSACDHSTICSLPCGLGLPPHFMVSVTLTKIKLLKSWPPAGTPPESTNDPVCPGRNLLFCFCGGLPHRRGLHLCFIVIALPLVAHLLDLSRHKGKNMVELSL